MKKISRSNKNSRNIYLYLIWQRTGEFHATRHKRKFPLKKAQAKAQATRYKRLVARFSLSLARDKGLGFCLK